MKLTFVVSEGLLPYTQDTIKFILNV